MFVIVIDGCLDDCVHFADVIGYFSTEKEAIAYLHSEGYEQDTAGDYIKNERKGLSSTYYEATIKELNKIN